MIPILPILAWTGGIAAALRWPVVSFVVQASWFAVGQVQRSCKLPMAVLPP